MNLANLLLQAENLDVKQAGDAKGNTPLHVAVTEVSLQPWLLLSFFLFNHFYVASSSSSLLFLSLVYVSSAVAALVFVSSPACLSPLTLIDK